MGLCPLNTDRRPSLLVDPGKSLFYCYGCGRGGDVIRLVELTHGVPFGEALALLRRWSGLDALLSDAIQFYQVQLLRHLEAIAYLAHRGVRQPDVVEQMRIGYAPSRCLRAWLMRLCYSLRDLQQAGSVNSPRFEAFLASLYADADARERFITDPRGEAARAGVDAAQIEALAAMDFTGLASPRGASTRSVPGKRRGDRNDPGKMPYNLESRYPG